ncbi:8013_t:CDS:2, partial [Gigaspora margarita]
GPSARETKTHLVLVYVDLQKQLVALETQMRMETKAAQEKFTMSLPKDTPSVIPEVIHIPINKPTSTPLSSPPPIEDNELSESHNHHPKSSSRSSYFDRDNASLKVEPSIPPSHSQSSSIRSKSLRRSKTTLKRIFISKPTCNRANSSDTMNNLSRTSFSSSPHNIHACSPTQHYSSAPSTPMTPNYLVHLNNENKLNSISATDNERCEINERCENIQENRDSGIALVSPGGRSNHSRDQSFSSLLRKIDPFNTFQRGLQPNGERKEKNRGPIYSTIIKSKENDHQHELLAFRYPSLKNIRYATGNINSIFDGIFDQDDSFGNDDLYMIEDSVVKQKSKVKSNKDDMQISSLDDGKKTCGSLENSTMTLVFKDTIFFNSESQNQIMNK